MKTPKLLIVDSNMKELNYAYKLLSEQYRVDISHTASHAVSRLLRSDSRLYDMVVIGSLGTIHSSSANPLSPGIDLSQGVISAALRKGIRTTTIHFDNILMLSQACYLKEYVNHKTVIVHDLAEGEELYLEVDAMGNVVKRMSGEDMLDMIVEFDRNPKYTPKWKITYNWPLFLEKTGLLNSMNPWLVIKKSVQDWERLGFPALSKYRHPVLTAA